MSHVSVVVAVDERVDTPLDRIAEEGTVLESEDENEVALAVVELYVISQALIYHRQTYLELVNRPAVEVGEDKAMLNTKNQSRRYLSVFIGGHTLSWLRLV